MRINYKIIRYLILSIIALSSLIFFTNSTQASNTDRANTIYEYLDHKYQDFSISEQEQKRETMKSLFHQIERKTDNPDLLILVDTLIFKAERKIDALKTYEESYPNGNDDLSNIEQLRFEILNLVNLERSKIGLNNLSLNIHLNTAAQGHAEYMAQTDDFAHTTKDGLEFNTRIQNAGYGGKSMGENIARNQRTPGQVMEAWMNSPGHKENILNTKFTEIGIGFEDYYWVQNFGG